MIRLLSRTLALALLFILFNRLIGARASRQWLIRNHIRPRPGDRILDIGCGTAEVLAFLPEVHYVGYDLSESYIASARKRFGDRGRFHCAHVDAVAMGDQRFDIVLGMGILHHLDDKDCQTFLNTARNVLVPGGRLITSDPCFTTDQHPVARYLAKRDRGRFVRDREAYLQLTKPLFSEVTHKVTHNRLRFPFTHMVMECLP